jgi:hypothetical protein
MSSKRTDFNDFIKKLESIGESNFQNANILKQTNKSFKTFNVKIESYFDKLDKILNENLTVLELKDESGKNFIKDLKEIFTKFSGVFDEHINSINSFVEQQKKLSEVINSGIQQKFSLSIPKENLNDPEILKNIESSISDRIEKIYKPFRSKTGLFSKQELEFREQSKRLLKGESISPINNKNYDFLKNIIETSSKKEDITGGTKFFEKEIPTMNISKESIKDIDGILRKNIKLVSRLIKRYGLSGIKTEETETKSSGSFVKDLLTDFGLGWLMSSRGTKPRRGLGKASRFRRKLSGARNITAGILLAAMGELLKSDTFSNFVSSNLGLDANKTHKFFDMIGNGTELIGGLILSFTTLNGVIKPLIESLPILRSGISLFAGAAGTAGAIPATVAGGVTAAGLAGLGKSFFSGGLLKVAGNVAMPALAGYGVYSGLDALGDYTNKFLPKGYHKDEGIVGNALSGGGNSLKWGLTSAATGATLGARVGGPVGALYGGLGGLALGTGAYALKSLGEFGKEAWEGALYKDKSAAAKEELDQNLKKQEKLMKEKYGNNWENVLKQKAANKKIEQSDKDIKDNKIYQEQIKDKTIPNIENQINPIHNEFQFQKNRADSRGSQSSLDVKDIIKATTSMDSQKTLNIDKDMLKDVIHSAVASLDFSNMININSSGGGGNNDNLISGSRDPIYNFRASLLSPV